MSALTKTREGKKYEPARLCNKHVRQLKLSARRPVVWIPGFCEMCDSQQERTVDVDDLYDPKEGMALAVILCFAAALCSGLIVACTAGWGT
jgi:hypothetical protein